MATKEEWKHIEIYNTGKADLDALILGYFEKQLPEEVARWIRIDREYSLEQVAEAQAEGAKAEA